MRRFILFQRKEEGAALVEFALILPLFMMLVLGLFSGGLAYNRKQTLTHAAREAARYGATLPDADVVSSTWRDTVLDTAVSNAQGELDSSEGSRHVCVAYVPSTGNALKREVTGSGSETNGTGTCYTDGLTFDRVQVVVERDSEFEALLFSRTITLDSRSSSRYER